ncbi:MAG: hypothetical protein N2691_05935 [Patescibacteria group bacterium]|nr:hypothetical protein [Patescibacteria group bacterium]
MISAKQYQKKIILKYKKTTRKKGYRTEKNFYPFRQLIACVYCKKNMWIAPSTGARPYLYARCGTKRCERSKKSIRIKVVLDYLYSFFSEGLNFSEHEYRKYLEKIKVILEKKHEELQRQCLNKQGVLNQLTHEINERSLKIIHIEEDSPIYRANEKKILELQAEASSLENDIKKNKI